MAYKKKTNCGWSLYMMVYQLFLSKGWLPDTTLSVSPPLLGNHESCSAVCADRYINESKRLETASRALAEGSERVAVNRQSVRSG